MQVVFECFTERLFLIFFLKIKSCSDDCVILFFQLYVKESELLLCIYIYNNCIL